MAGNGLAEQLRAIDDIAGEMNERYGYSREPGA